MGPAESIVLASGQEGRRRRRRFVAPSGPRCETHQILPTLPSARTKQRTFVDEISPARSNKPTQQAPHPHNDNNVSLMSTLGRAGHLLASARPRVSITPFDYISQSRAGAVI
jgi:hypothetical protein